MNKILALGTIVYMKNSNEKIMVISRGAIYGEAEEECYYDYVGVKYPVGFDQNQTVFFNHDNVDEVIFYGYTDSDEERFLQLYDSWQQSTTITKGVI